MYKRQSQLSLEDIYNEVFTLEKGEMNNLKSDVAAKFARAQDTFSDAPVDDKDREYLKPVSYTHLDVYKRQRYRCIGRIPPCLLYRLRIPVPYRTTPPHQGNWSERRKRARCENEIGRAHV